MSNFNVKDENPGFSITKLLEDVSHHGHTQTEALKERQRTLSSLQANLSDVEKKFEPAEQELRSKVREILMLEGELEHLGRQTDVLRGRCVSVNKENTQLQSLIREEEENGHLAAAKFVAYRKKMESHRAAVWEAVSLTEAHKELEGKKVLVQKLREKKDQLRKDLENPNGSTVQIAKGEIDALRNEISGRKMTITDMREQLKKECDGHAHLRKEIQIQSRRHEAIVKRLHCQLSRAQAIYRQVSDDIYHLQRQLAELKKRQQS
ncbi:coiled-coil domain-containing protein 122 [Menidia menidia]